MQLSKKGFSKPSAAYMNFLDHDFADVFLPSLCLYFTQFSPMVHFCTSRKREKTKGLLTSSGGIEVV